MLLSGKVTKSATVVAVALPFATVKLTGSGKVVPGVRVSCLTHVDDADPSAVRAARETAASAQRQNAARAQRRLAASTARVFQVSEEVRPRASQLPRPLPRDLRPRSALTRPATSTPGSPRGRARHVA